jgi:hypothetical protein
MEGLAASVVLMGILLVVAFDLFCLVHLAAADRLRFLPKLAWAVDIMCVSPSGASFTRSRNSSPRRSADSAADS